MHIRTLLLTAAIAAGPLAACGDDDGGAMPDSGTMTVVLPPAQKGEVSPDDPQGIDPATALAADFSCAGTRTAPAEGESISFTLTVEDFQEGNPVPGVCVEVYADNMVPASDTCTGETTDESGNITVMDAAGSWYAYRVFPKEGPTAATTVVGSVQYNEPAPAESGGTTTGNSVSLATISLIPSVLGFRREEGTAIVAGTITDCADDPIYGMHVRLFTEDGTQILEGERNSDPHYRYFDGEEFPDSTQPWSHVDGLFAVGNVPADAAGTPIFMELWGSAAADLPAELLGCETGKVFPDTVTILNIGPTRADGPACPSAM